MVHTYKKRFLDSDGTYDIIQIREDQDDRVISEQNQQYVDFLANGGEPIIIPFVPQPEQTLEEAKLNAIKRMHDARRQDEFSGVDYGEYKISTTREDQSALGLAYLDLSQDYEKKINWKCEDDLFVEIDYTDVVEIIVLVRNHIQNAFDKEMVKVGQINSATTIAEVEDVVWE